MFDLQALDYYVLNIQYILYYIVYDSFSLFLIIYAICCNFFHVYLNFADIKGHTWYLQHRKVKCVNVQRNSNILVIWLPVMV